MPPMSNPARKTRTAFSAAAIFLLAGGPAVASPGLFQHQSLAEIPHGSEAVVPTGTVRADAAIGGITAAAATQLMGPGQVSSAGVESYGPADVIGAGVYGAPGQVESSVFSEVVQWTVVSDDQGPRT